MNDDQVFRLNEALSRIDHDWDVFSAMVELFLENGPQDLKAIKAAVDAGDSVALSKSAHRLKGSVMQFCASGSFDAAQALEMMGKAGDLTKAGETYKRLEAELDRLIDALRLALDKGRLAA